MKVKVEEQNIVELQNKEKEIITKYNEIALQIKEKNKILMTLILQFAILTDPEKFELDATFHKGKLVNIAFFNYKNEKNIKFLYLTEIDRLKNVIPFFKGMAKHLPHNEKKMGNLVNSLLDCEEVIIEKNKIRISDI
jgi:hypothetical protein